MKFKPKFKSDFLKTNKAFKSQHQSMIQIIYSILFQLITISPKWNKSMDLGFNIQSGTSKGKLFQLFPVKEELEEDLSI